MFSDHSGIKLEINKERDPKESSNIWELSSTLLNNPEVKEVIKRETERIEVNKKENTIYLVWDAAKGKHCKKRNLWN